MYNIYNIIYIIYIYIPFSSVISQIIPCNIPIFSP